MSSSEPAHSRTERPAGVTLAVDGAAFAARFEQLLANGDRRVDVAAAGVLNLSNYLAEVAYGLHGVSITEADVQTVNAAVRVVLALAERADRMQRQAATIAGAVQC